MIQLQPQTNMENYLTVKEALYELSNKIGRTTLYKLMDNGALPKYKLGGRVFLAKADISTLMKRA